MPPIKTILVPTDFSPHSERALEHAIDLARALGAELHVVHALRVPDQVPVDSTWWGGIRSRALGALARTKQDAAKGGVDCETHLADDPPLQAILELSESLQADLIVMGSRGLTGLRHTLLGSIAERTVRLAACPVLTLHADESESPS